MTACCALFASVERSRESLASFHILLEECDSLEKKQEAQLLFLLHEPSGL